ncbi:MAG: hypothetical protein ABIT70_10120 [Sulfuriferula sp.]
MKVKKVITAEQARFAAQVFNIASVTASLIVPLLMIWIAASIFAYASIAHHPNPRTADYNRFAGYRFYGAAGGMMVFGQPIYMLFDNWHGLVAVWGILAIVVVPWGLWSIYKAGHEEWQDMTIEVDTNE